MAHALAETLRAGLFAGGIDQEEGYCDGWKTMVAMQGARLAELHADELQHAHRACMDALSAADVDRPAAMAKYAYLKTVLKKFRRSLDGLREQYVKSKAATFTEPTPTMMYAMVHDGHGLMHRSISMVQDSMPHPDLPEGQDGSVRELKQFAEDTRDALFQMVMPSNGSAMEDGALELRLGTLADQPLRDLADSCLWRLYEHNRATVVDACQAVLLSVDERITASAPRRAMACFWRCLYHALRMHLERAKDGVRQRPRMPEGVKELTEHGAVLKSALEACRVAKSLLPRIGDDVDAIQRVEPARKKLRLDADAEAPAIHKAAEPAAAPAGFLRRTTRFVNSLSRWMTRCPAPGPGAQGKYTAQAVEVITDVPVALDDVNTPTPQEDRWRAVPFEEIRCHAERAAAGDGGLVFSVEALLPEGFYVHSLELSCALSKECPEALAALWNAELTAISTFSFAVGRTICSADPRPTFVWVDFPEDHPFETVSGCFVVCDTSDVSAGPEPSAGE